jgi:hypothetical protein
MKSFVQEGTSIDNAIQNAWSIAGKPQKFYIKVLEEGHNSLLWWKKKPYKIAFYYELNEFPSGDECSFNGPHKTTLESNYRKGNFSRDRQDNQNFKNTHHSKDGNLPKKPFPPRQNPDYDSQKNRPEQDSQKSFHENPRSYDNPKPQNQQRPFRQPAQDNTSFSENINPKRNVSEKPFEKTAEREPRDFNQDSQMSVFMWTPETSNFVSNWLRETFKNLQIDIKSLDVKIDKENMYITFKDEEIKSQAEYKYLPLSLVTLIQEALKKYTKEYHKVFRIFIQYQ